MAATRRRGALLALCLAGCPAWARAQDVARHSRSWWVPALHATALLGAQRAAEMVLWRHAFSLEDGARNERFLRRAFTEPPAFDASRRFFEWDGDQAAINVIGHGLMGSELYLRARQCRHGVWASLAFTAATAAVWEYAVEVWNAPPSLNDLVWTPLGGALLGELRFAAWELAGALSPVARGVVRGVVDPFGELERALGAGC